MSDEYKYRYIIQCCRNPHPGLSDRHEVTVSSSTELNLEGKLKQNNEISQIRIIDRLLTLH